MIQNFEHIIWDWNGTLLNDTELSLNIINELLKSKNLNTLSLADYRRIFDFPVEKYYETAGFNFNDYSFEVVGKLWMDEYERRKGDAILFEETVTVLNFISSLGIDQSILSAYSLHTLIEMVNNHGLTKYFKYITGLDHIYATSKLEIGKDLIKKINVPLQKIVLIGDTLHDHDVAGELGIKCILIANGHQSKERLLLSGDPVLNNISDLIA
ncbi:MAG: HAD hydrolase-like protein [Ignavibacteriaceae bacterium]|nr:HAD hydrolase-like protein [Ignavibacteriaceae bacterium]